MIALTMYVHATYMRSYRYVPPLLLLIIIMVWIYSLVPNPVMGSYAFTSALLFAVSAWLAFGFIDTEHETQLTLTALHAGSLSRLTAAKLLYAWVFTAPLVILLVLYPALLHKFDRTPSVYELAAALAGHLSLSLLGIACGVFFTARFIPRLTTSAPGLLAIVALALAGGGIHRMLPESVAFLAWLLPPVHVIMNALDAYPRTSGLSIWAACGFGIIYGVAALTIFVLLLRHKGLTAA
ncbi:hypothetical protein ACFFSY_30675 [Paenibacillus aurantiacus]|uniref:ABC transporter permease n=1 Tax=Paenibacillus aurantiacus TaxID=1936118 RepID=A0ABV5KYN7_9BACL